MLTLFPVSENIHLATDRTRSLSARQHCARGNSMNQRDLEYFLSVADAGSFSQAAILLGKPQPALSKHVRDLELDLRTALLYRNGRGVVLTEAGKRLRVRAKAILEQIAEARTEALGISQGGITAATLGMPPSVARLFAAPIAQSLHAAYPGICLRLMDGFNGYLLEWLTAGRLDAAILYGCEATTRLNAEPLLTEEMQLIGAGEGRPAEIPAESLSGVPLILPSQVHGLRAQVDAWAGRNGIRLSVRTECDAFASLLELVGAGHGCTILPKSAVRHEIATGRLGASRITGASLRRRLVLAMPPERSGSAELAKLIKSQFCAAVG
jgi:LysR family nitrogen assimilation transcriptional regulator